MIKRSIQVVLDGRRFIIKTVDGEYRAVAERVERNGKLEDRGYWHIRQGLPKDNNSLLGRILDLAEKKRDAA